MSQSSQKSRIKVPLILMLWPVVGLILAILVYAVVNFAIGSLGNANDTSVLRAITNIILFLLGVGSIVLGPPSFVVGLVLLVSRQSNSDPGPSRNETTGEANGLAVAGMVLGIIALVTSLFGVGAIIGIIGLCLSAVAMKQVGRQGMAIAGLVMSICSVVIGAVFITIVANNGV